MKKSKLPNIVVVAILTVITVVFWIALDVYRAFTIKPAPSVAQEILAPLDPTLDADKLSELQKRVYIDPSNLAKTVVVNPVESTPAPESTSEATPAP